MTPDARKALLAKRLMPGSLTVTWLTAATSHAVTEGADPDDVIAMSQQPAARRTRKASWRELHATGKLTASEIARGWGVDHTSVLGALK